MTANVNSTGDRCGLCLRRTKRSKPCGAVIGKIKMSVDSVTVLYQMFLAKWAEQDGCLSGEDMKQIMYRYSRELEHSDVNLEVMQNV